MKVLMIVTQLNIGGTETYVLSLAQALRAQGVDVGIATTGGPLVSTCHHLGIPVHLVSEQSSRTPTAYAVALATILMLHGYQIVHVHDTRAFRAMKPLVLAFPVRVVVTVHGTYFHKLLIKNVAQQAQVLISVSPNLSHWIRSCGVPIEKIRVIPNGIDTTHFSPVAQQNAARNWLRLPASGKIIAYAARFSKDKQTIAQQIIRAGEQINRAHPQVYTVLAGPGPYRAALSQMAAAANKRLGRQAIIVRPAITNIRSLYRSADIVIGTGRVALEAMACGKPVLAAGVKGYLGLVTPQGIERAIACHFGDHSAGAPLTVTALTTDINRMLKKPELTQSLSKFGRQLVVQRFSIVQIAKQMKQIYETAGHLAGAPVVSKPSSTAVSRQKSTVRQTMPPQKRTVPAKKRTVPSSKRSQQSASRTTRPSKWTSPLLKGQARNPVSQSDRRVMWNNDKSIR